MEKANEAELSETIGEFVYNYYNCIRDAILKNRVDEEIKAKAREICLKGRRLLQEGKRDTNFVNPSRLHFSAMVSTLQNLESAIELGISLEPIVRIIDPYIEKIDFAMSGNTDYETARKRQEVAWLSN